MLPTDSVWVWITDNYKYTCTLKENIFDDNNLSSILKKNQIISAVAYLIFLQIIDNKQIVHNYFLWCIYGTNFLHEILVFLVCDDSRSILFFKKKTILCWNDIPYVENANYTNAEV